MKEKRIRKSITLDESMWRRIEELAEKEMRSQSNMVEVIINSGVIDREKR